MTLPQIIPTSLAKQKGNILYKNCTVGAVLVLRYRLYLELLAVSKLVAILLSADSSSFLQKYFSPFGRFPRIPESDASVMFRSLFGEIRARVGVRDEFEMSSG